MASRCMGRNRGTLMTQALHSRLFSSENDSRLGRTLYRQLLRWCKDVDKTIPLSSFVPPVTLKPPHVEPTSLIELTAPDEYWTPIAELLPAKSKVESHQITVPIHNSEDAANFFRVVFRMNKVATSPEAFKQRISVAFDALKSLNELTGGLNSLKEQRDKHMDRTGVTYHVGQVVQHKAERWRGVITGWQREMSSGNEKLSSLTKKVYDVGEKKGDAPDVPLGDDNQKDDDDVQYSLILDSGDAHLLGGKRQVHDMTGAPVAMQSELELVKDDSLVRIRSNWIANCFDRFDLSTQRFVPNAVRAYEYPLDNEGSIPPDPINTARRNELGSRVVNGVQEFASMLERHILDETSSPESRGMSILARFRDQLSSLARGDVVPNSAFLSAKDLSSGDLAIFHLRALLDIHLEISELLYIRNVSKEKKERIQFSLGDVVQHKKYGFRGIIVAWDPEPAVDVSQWDGLAEIENASKLPFYHIIPNQNDCIEAFGSERPFRYVCEANLELCPRERSFFELDLDMEPGWERRATDPGYTPPDDVKFKYADDDNDVTESCLRAIMDDITRLQVSLREASPHEATEFDDISNKLSLETIFEMLQLSDTMDGAIVLEETIKEIWKAHKNRELRLSLDDGIANLLRGNKERALTIFKTLVDEDPDYAEAWNKASTCHFMLGDMQSSLEAAERTLELIPKHFQAMNGLGLVQYDTRRYMVAANSFRQSLTLDPWSPVSSRLAACLDMLHGSDLEGASR